MILNTQKKCRYDILQYSVDDVMCVRTITISGGVPAALVAGDAINPTTGAKLTGTDTAVVVVADGVAQGATSVVVFDKLVSLIKSQINGASTAGTTKALELLATNDLIRLV